MATQDNLVKNKYVLITHGQSYVGYTTAIHIADQLERLKDGIKKHWKVRVLCQDKSKLEHLKKRGIEVHEVDYRSAHMIQEQMKDKIKILIFNPFTETGNLIEEGKNMIDCAVKSNVKRIAMISVMGCQLSKENGPLHHFYKLEKYVEEQQKYGYWVILRLPFLQQFYYFWASMVENGILGLPLSKTDVLHDVNIQDVCECLAQVSLSKKHTIWNQDDIAATYQRVYELYCPPLTFSMVASELSSALREYDETTKIRSITLTDDQFKRYLEYTSGQKPNLLKELLSTLIDTDEDTTLNNSNLLPYATGDFQDDPSFVPNPSIIITQFFIDLLLDYMRMVRGNQPVPILPNHDIRNLTGRDPIRINEFFKSNLRHFNPGYDM